MTRPLTIALLQISPTGTLAGNLAKGIQACRRAAELGADIALFPEMWSNGYALHGRPSRIGYPRRLTRTATSSSHSASWPAS